MGQQARSTTEESQSGLPMFGDTFPTLPDPELPRSQRKWMIDLCHNECCRIAESRPDVAFG